MIPDINITVVGKIDLKPKEVTGDFFSIYNHFAKRLQERYGLHITRKEYKSLCKEPYKVISEKRGILMVDVVFKGVDVRTIRRKGGGRLLVTALPKHF